MNEDVKKRFEEYVWDIGAILTDIYPELEAWKDGSYPEIKGRLHLELIAELETVETLLSRGMDALERVVKLSNR
jgi:hypothetical protein